MRISIVSWISLILCAWSSLCEAESETPNASIPSPQMVAETIQNAGTIPEGCDPSLPIHIQTILEAKGQFEFDLNGEVIGIDFTKGRTSISEKILPSVFYFSNLSKLRIVGNLSPEAITKFTQLSHLRELFLQDTSMDTAAFVRLMELPELTTLGVRRAAKLTDEAMKSLDKNHTLTSLSLIDLNLSNATCADIARVESLKLVDLRGCSQISVHGIRSLAELPVLKAIRLKEIPNSDEMLQAFAEFPSLKSITLEECDITTNGLRLLSELQPEEVVLFRCMSVNDQTLQTLLTTDSELRRLTIRDCILMGKTLSQCAALEKLVDLRLPETWVDDEAMQFLQKCVSLRRLELRATRVTDATMEQIASLQHLECLNLQGTRITDAGLKKLENSTTLQYLNISQTTVSEEAVQKFHESHPQCQIDRRIAY